MGQSGVKLDLSGKKWERENLLEKELGRRAIIEFKQNAYRRIYTYVGREESHVITCEISK